MSNQSKFEALYEKNRESILEEYIDSPQTDFCNKYGLSKTYVISVFGRIKSQSQKNKMRAYQKKRDLAIKEALGKYTHDEMKSIYFSMYLEDFVTMYGKHDRFWKNLFGAKPLKLIPYIPVVRETPKETYYGEPTGYKPFIKLPIFVGNSKSEKSH